jgi:hypothetical protein
MKDSGSRTIYSFASRGGEALLEKRFFRRFFPTNLIARHTLENIVVAGG